MRIPTTVKQVLAEEERQKHCPSCSSLKDKDQDYYFCRGCQQLVCGNCWYQGKHGLCYKCWFEGQEEDE